MYLTIYFYIKFIMRIGLTLEVLNFLYRFKTLFIFDKYYKLYKIKGKYFLTWTHKFKYVTFRFDLILKKYYFN